MTDRYKQRLISIGVNLDDTLDRFMGNESLYEKFLLKFLEDKSFQQLEESIVFLQSKSFQYLDNDIKSQKIHDSFMWAHTLKGIADNMGFDCLLKILSPMTEKLRNKNTEKIQEDMENLKEQYNVLSCMIQDSHTL